MDVVGALNVIGWVWGKGTGVGCRARTGDQGRECGKGERVGSRGAGTPTPPFARVWDPTRAMSLFLSFYLLFIDWLASPKPSLLL